MEHTSPQIDQLIADTDALERRRLLLTDRAARQVLSQAGILIDPLDDRPPVVIAEKRLLGAVVDELVAAALSAEDASDLNLPQIPLE